MKSSMLIHPDELSEAWIDRLARAGIKTLGIHPKGGRNAAKSLEEMIEMMKTPNYRRLIDYAQIRGLDVEYEIHAAGYLLPRTLFEKHPEYFRMNENGERTSDRNLCVSNAQAVELFSKRAYELAISLYGSNHNFYFWLDDGRDVHCHCPKCRDLSPSDQQMILVNSMHNEIRSHLPDARMAYLAYADSMTPPEKTEPANGVFLEYAPMEKYKADGKERAAEEEKMIFPLLELFGRDGAKVLEYWYDNSMFSNWEKPPRKFSLNESGMRADIRKYSQMGFEYMSTFACFLGSDYENLHGAVDIAPFAEAVGEYIIE